MSDDPIEWLVKEFGAEVNEDKSFAWIDFSDDWLVEYHAEHNEWLVLDCYTSQPLTRADVARLCELFGVEVKQ